MCSGLDAGFAAAGTHARALAPGLLEVFAPRLQRADTAEVALHASAMSVLAHVATKDAAKKVLRIVYCRFP